MDLNRSFPGSFVRIMHLEPLPRPKREGEFHQNGGSSTFTTPESGASLMAAVPDNEAEDPGRAWQPGAGAETATALASGARGQTG